MYKCSKQGIDVRCPCERHTQLLLTSTRRESYNVGFWEHLTDCLRLTLSSFRFSNCKHKLSLSGNRRYERRTRGWLPSDRGHNLVEIHRCCLSFCILCMPSTNSYLLLRGPFERFDRYSLT